MEDFELEKPDLEPSPFEMSGLERTSVFAPTTLLDAAFGYSGSNRYVSFHWSPKHDKLFLCDGLLRGYRSESTVWWRFLSHPIVAPHLRHFTKDYKSVEPYDFSARVIPLPQTTLFSTEADARRMEADVAANANCLLLDRKEGEIYVGPWSSAQLFHSLLGDEVLDNEEDEFSGEVEGQPEDRLIAWLDKCADDPDHLIHVASSMSRFHDWQRELELLERCVQLRPESDRFHFRLSHSYAHFGHWEEALDACEKATRLQASAAKPEENPGRLLMWLGRCRFALQRYEDAIDAYELVLAIDRRWHDTEAYREIGRCHTKLRRYKEAVEAHEKELQLQAEESTGNLLALRHFDPGEHYSDLVAIDRCAVEGSFVALGKAHILAGQLCEAEDVFEKALRVQPDSVRAQTYLAIVHALMGKLAIAAEEFNIAAARGRLRIEQHPDSSSCHAALAFVYKAMDNRTAASEHYRRASELGWSSQDEDEEFSVAVRANSASGCAEP